MLLFLSFLASLAKAITYCVSFDENMLSKCPDSADNKFTIDNFSLNVDSDLKIYYIPNEGRVVLYISMIDEDGKEGEKIAIAPLTIGKCEVVNLDYTINSFAPVIFSTEGCNVSISINGYTTSAEQLTFEKI